MNTALIIRAMPGIAPRNGLTVKPYRYRGTGEDILTPHLDEADDVSALDDELDLRPHGTAAAERRHYRNKTPLCDSCRQYQHRRAAELAARDVASGKTVRAVHAPNGGRPWCGVWNIENPVIAEPGQEITCGRCKNAMGRTA